MESRKDSSGEEKDTSKGEDHLYYLPERISKDYLLLPKKHVLASFDHILSDYSGAFGRFQALMILLVILLAMAFKTPDILRNAITPRLILEDIQYRCVPLHKNLSAGMFGFNVIDNVFRNVRDRCRTFQIYNKPWNTISRRQNLSAYVRTLTLMDYLNNNKTLPTNFAKTVRCYEDPSSAVMFNQLSLRKNKYQKSMETAYEQFQMVCYGRSFYNVINRPITYYYFSSSIGSLILGVLADLYGRYQVSKYLAYLLAVHIFVPVAPTYPALLLSYTLAGFRDLPLYYLMVLVMMESTTWTYRAKFLAITYTGDFLNFTVDMLGRGFCPSWRLYLFIFALPGILTWTLFAWRFFESPRWQLAKGHLKEAADGLYRMAHINNREVKQDDLGMDVEAVTETEFFQRQGSRSFCKYVKLQKKSFGILMVNFLIYIATSTERTNRLDMTRVYSDNWPLAFAELAGSAVMCASVCKIFGRHGLYNRPMFIMCICGTIWYFARVAFWFFYGIPNPANAGYLNYRLCFLAEEFVNSFINNCVFFGLLLQIFHTAPTIHRATWTLTIVGSFAFTAPLFKSLRNVLPSQDLFFYIEKSLIIVLYMVGAITQKYMPVINPLVSEADLIEGKNLLQNEKLVMYELFSKKPLTTSTSTQKSAGKLRPDKKCC